MKFLKGIVVIIGILVLIGIYVGPNEQDRTTATTRSEPKQPKRPVANCEQGTPVSGTFYVKGSDINFRAGPGIDHAFVINRKATDVLGKTHYRTLSPSLVLDGRCETVEWLQARIVKADGNAVNWETGWVHKQFVTGEASDDMKAGLLWDIDGESEFTDAEKQVVKRGALKVLRDEANCAEITTGYRSGSRKGAYYVTCNAKNGGSPFNVWFTPDEVETGSTLASEWLPAVWGGDGESAFGSDWDAEVTTSPILDHYDRISRILDGDQLCGASSGQFGETLECREDADVADVSHIPVEPGGGVGAEPVRGDEYAIEDAGVKVREVFGNTPNVDVDCTGQLSGIRNV